MAIKKGGETINIIYGENLYMLEMNIPVKNAKEKA